MLGAQHSHESLVIIFQIKITKYAKKIYERISTN